MKTYRSFFAVLLVVLTLLGCVACGEKKAATNTPPTQNNVQQEEVTTPNDPAEDQILFPKGITILGNSVEGLNPQQAYELIDSLITAYAIEARVNDSLFYIKAEDVLLQVSLEDIAEYAKALAEDPTTAKEPEAKLDSALLRQKIAAGTGSSVVDAKVSYNRSTQSFQISKARSGVSVDTYAASQVLEPAMLKLEPSASVKVEVHETEPSVKSDDPRLKSAADKANAYLKVSITYVYAPEQVAAKSQAVTKNDIGGMISFNGSMEPYINASAVNNYAIAMNDKYCVRGKYETPDGVQMEGFGPIVQAVDVQALAADLKGCLEKGISGTRNAPYGARVEANEGQLADCVIVNLSAQHMYVYNKSGACVVSTPIVSGCVANGTHTIRGVFKIYAKSRNVTLSGPGYASPVKYWMPFSGGYGLHDANWRSSFGGEIYLYDGSHGCVNIPPAAAGTVYENVSVGTTVLIYGGANTVKERPQSLVAIGSHKVLHTAEPFDLNVTYLGIPTLRYTSSNPEVATVSQNGKVTVVGVGETTITVDAPAHGSYLAGTLDIKITVVHDCQVQHEMTWKTTKEPTCISGKQVGTCVHCGYLETKTLDPISGHAYEGWTQTKAPTCVAGEETGTCSSCGATTTRSVEPIQDHTYGEWTTTQAPTCVAGEETGTCSSCGATTTRSVGPIQDHTYGEWTTTKAPTCGAEGVQSSTCSGCGDTKTQPVAMTGDHDFTAGGEVCGNGCGTKNPDYVPPAENA